MKLGHNFFRVNSKWKQVLGWEEEELLGCSYLSFIHPEDLEKTLEYEKNFIPTGFYNRWRCKDGTYRYLSWTGISPVGSSAQKERPSFSIVRDITIDIIVKEEHKKQIQLLNERLMFNNKVVQAISDLTKLYLGPLATLTEGPEDNLEALINHFVRLTDSGFGLLIQEPKEEIIHISQKDLLFSNTAYELSAAQFSQIEEVVRHALATHTTETLEGTGNDSLSSVVAIPLVKRNRIVGILALANRQLGYPAYLIQWLAPLLSLSTHLVSEINLTRINRTIEELEIAWKKAEIESSAKTAFLAHMSHELRTPLSGIIGLLDLINDKSLNPQEVEYLAMSRESAASLLHILNDILDLSAVEAGQLKLEELPFNPRTIVEEVTRLLSSQAKEKGILLSLRYDPSIPEFLIGDPSRFRQILFNLLGNALKFTEGGTITVSFEGSVCLEHPPLFALTSIVKPDTYKLDTTVEDSGIGMTPETVSSLFHPFTQGDQSISRRFGGTGLGLFICKQLCVLMGGDIDATSTIDQGSTFHFFLYLRLPENQAIQHAIPSIPIPTLPPLQVLVVEDNSVNQLILKEMLKKSGCASITMVWNGVQAVEAVRLCSYDLILMDVQMPVMDGLEATRQIRRTSSVPIIGVTAHAFVDDKKKALNSGMNACIVKPIHRQELVEVILFCLNSSERPQSSPLGVKHK